MDNQFDNNQEPEIIDVTPNPSQEKKNKNRKNSFFWPFILIAVGVIFLVQNLSPVPVHLNWWAVFIYFPVVGSIFAGINAFEKSGKFDAAVRSSLSGVIVVGTVATMLLLGVDWRNWWPLMLIAPGLSMLINSISVVDADKHVNLARWAGLGFWFGLATLLLGVGFLAKSLPIPVIEAYLFSRWWAVAILIPRIGAIINAIILLFSNGLKVNWTVGSFLVIGLVFVATGLFALYNLNWNLLSPIILIGTGLVVFFSFFIRK
mgnify:FL=1